MMKVYNISNSVFEPGLLLNRRRNFRYFLRCEFASAVGLVFLLGQLLQLADESAKTFSRLVIQNVTGVKKKIPQWT